MRRWHAVLMLLGALLVGATTAHSQSVGPTVAGCPTLPADNVWNARVDGLSVDTLQPHFLITAIERKLCSLFSPCFEHMIEMSLLLIGNVSMGPNHVFSMACRIRAWSGH